MAPVIPYSAEKHWSERGHEDLVSCASCPVAVPVLINKSVEVSEELLPRTVEDIQSSRKLVQIEATKVTLFVAPAWKHQVFTIVASAEDKRNVVKTVMADADLRAKGKDATDAAMQTVKLIHSLPPELVTSIAAGVDELAIFTAAKAVLEKESGLAVEVVAAEASAHPKGKLALPFNPAIGIE